jgi:DNA-binding beta-propeller fold protein YncE
LVVRRDGSLLVAEKSQNRLQCFSREGEWICVYGEAGKRDGQFNCPVDLVEDPYGYVFVVDTLNQRIQKFDPEMNFVSKWGVIGKESGQFKDPAGICLSWEPDWVPSDE